MRYKKIVIAAVASCAAVGLAACGSSTAAAQAPAPSSAPSSALANEQAFANWLATAQESAPAISGAISGPVMQEYAQYQDEYAQAVAQGGYTNPSLLVSPTPGGYRECTSKGSCLVLSGFKTDAAGKITDADINGVPISSRIATAPDNNGSQLAITNVIAYRPASDNGNVVIVYTVTNISSEVVGSTQPGWLATFANADGVFQYDPQNSSNPGPLQPGQSATVYDQFNTQTINGTLALQDNGSNSAGGGYVGGNVVTTTVGQ